MNNKHIIGHCIEVFQSYPRHYYIFLFFFLFFLYIIWNIFSYTVLSYDFYRGLADKQQISTQKVPVTRGAIYSSGKQKSVLATSVNLDDLAIDPQIESDKIKLGNFLTQLVYQQFCYSESPQNCYNSMRKFLKVLEIPNFSSQESFVRPLIAAEIAERMKKTKITSVSLGVDLNDQSAALLRAKNLPGIYIGEETVYANPEEIVDIDATVRAIQEVFNFEAETLAHILRKRDLRYLPIVNRISISNSEYIKSYIDDERQAVTRGLLELENTIYRSLILTPNPSRLYPEDDLAAQIIGFVDNQGQGQYGLEGYFHDALKGEQSKVVTRKDIKGRSLRPIDDVFEQQINFKGANIVTTIDRSIQKNIERIIEDGVKQYQAAKGSIVVMEPQTGRIISMANYPRFDLNNPGDVYEIERILPGDYPNPETDFLGLELFVEDKLNGEEFYYDSREILLRAATDDERLNDALIKYKYKNNFGTGVYRNDAITALYEPGSIMKTITVAIGIDTGEITAHDLYNDTGLVKIDEFRIKNVSDKCLGYHSFAHALNYSCNVGMVRIAQKYGKALAYEYFNRFGFSQITGIDLGGEVTREIDHYEKWSRAKLFTSSYGLGIGVTPLQMASAYSTLVNGGVFITPKIIDSIELNDGRVLEYSSEKSHRVIKESTSDVMVDMLVDSLTNGVAGNGYVPGYSAGGKTGTSQIATGGVYETGVGSTFASFAGFGPAEDPKFVVIVKLDRPKTSEFGGATSAYLFKQTAEYLFNYYGIPKREVK